MRGLTLTNPSRRLRPLTARAFVVSSRTCIWVKGSCGRSAPNRACGMRSAGRKIRPRTKKMVCAFCVYSSSTTDLFYATGLSGKAILQDLVQENHAEYHELDDDTKASILKEYEEFKATKTTGTHISTKSKVNDVTQTLKAVENEVGIFFFISTILIIIIHS